MTLLGTRADAVTGHAVRKTKGESAPLDMQRLIKVTHYIDTHISQPITIEDLANVAGLSMYHFSRCFRAAVGRSPHAFVMARRIETSRQMLIESTQSLSQIAYVCGFSSQSHFTTKFREHVGATPGAYRKSGNLPEA